MPKATTTEDGEESFEGFLDPKTNKFTYEELCNKFPEGVKPNKKEYYLTDEDFNKHFKMGL